MVDHYSSTNARSVVHGDAADKRSSMAGDSYTIDATEAQTTSANGPIGIVTNNMARFGRRPRPA
jgi:hypothetical protein